MIDKKGKKKRRRRYTVFLVPDYDAGDEFEVMAHSEGEARRIAERKIEENPIYWELRIESITRGLL